MSLDPNIDVSCNIPILDVGIMKLWCWTLLRINPLFGFQHVEKCTDLNITANRLYRTALVFYLDLAGLRDPKP